MYKKRALSENKKVHEISRDEKQTFESILEMIAIFAGFFFKMKFLVE